jgi:hypothetical protein
VRTKSHTEITSISQPFVEEIVRHSGVPQNFVESAEATFAGLPDVDSDPDARAIMERLETARDGLAHRTNGHGPVNGHDAGDESDSADSL